MPRQTVRSLFQNDCNYHSYVAILEEERLITIDHRYVTKEIAAKTGGNTLCKRYKITTKGRILIDKTNEARIRFNLTSQGKKIIRNSAKSRKIEQQILTDKTAIRISNYLKSIINIEELYNFNQTQEQEDRKHNNNILAPLTEKRYEVSLNDKTGRFYTPFTNMTKSLKEKIKFKDGHILRCTIDARSCHPSFFGLYCQSITTEDLTGELLKWNHIFFVQEEHPMRAIYKECGLEYNDDTKRDFLAFLNGSQDKRYHGKFVNWFVNNFPKIFIVWSHSDKSQTGTIISKVYESAVFRHPKISELEKQLDITICDNHDELKIYANNNLAVKTFVDLFKSISSQVFNLKIVLKEEWHKQDGENKKIDSLIPDESCGKSKSKYLK